MSKNKAKTKKLSSEALKRLLDATTPLKTPLSDIRKNNNGQLQEYSKKHYGMTEFETGYQAGYGRAVIVNRMLKRHSRRAEWFQAGYDYAMRDIVRFIKQKTWPRIRKFQGKRRKKVKR